MPATRNSTSCPIFGDPKEHSGSDLPTHEQVIKHFLFVKFQLKSDSYNPPLYESFKNVAIHLLGVWQKASIPSVKQDRVIKVLKNYHGKYLNLLKTLKSTSIKQQTLDTKIYEFKQNSLKLFDISACKCVSFMKGSCPRENKVSQQEQYFLLDQRTSRKMIIGSIDTNETQKIKKRLLRTPVKSQASTSKEMSASQNKDDVEDTVLVLPDSSSESEIITSDYEPNSSTKRRLETSQSSLDLMPLAIMSDKTGASDRQVASLATVVLQGNKTDSDIDKSLIIDRHKIRRARKKIRRELQEKSIVEEPLESIYFDGRKDLTRVNDASGHIKNVREEHISLIQEPGSHYIGHLTPDTGTSKSITSSIMDFFSAKEVDTSQVVVIGCDGTAVNTGLRGGVIKLIEEKLGHPVHWLVCLLHANELPLRHLIHTVDGKTTGPSTFTGTIGKQLPDCEKK